MLIIIIQALELAQNCNEENIHMVETLRAIAEMTLVL